MASSKLILMGLMAATLGFGATGCASSSIVKKVDAAPITYKVGDGVTKYASLPTPRSPISRSTPESYIPARPMPQTQAPETFDQASIDTDLYKHQRLGKRYTIMGKSYTPKHQPDYDVTGVASWYGPKFHGKPTATGEIYDMHDFTAAHKTLPLNSMLYVTNVENGKSLMVRLNDRGPFVGDRIIDLSQASAKALGITGLGTVRVQYAGPADPMAAERAPVRPAVPVERPKENFAEAPAQRPLAAPAMPFTQPEPEPFVPVAPSRPQVTQPPLPDPESGNVTLTIKGPIHIASFTGPEPKLIRERVRTK